MFAERLQQELRVNVGEFMVFRFIAALFYDVLVIISLMMLCTAFCIAFNHGQAIPPASSWYRCLLAVILFFYQVLSIGYGGQTIGMRAWRLKIISDFGKISVYQAGWRLLCLPLAFSVALFCLKNPQNLLKRWSKTRVVSSESSDVC